MLAEQERQYEEAFDAMLAAEHARVGAVWPSSDSMLSIRMCWIHALQPLQVHLRSRPSRPAGYTCRCSMV